MRVGKGLFYEVNALSLKVVRFRFDLFGHPIIAHLERLKSRCAHFEYFWSLHICGWICVILSVRMARSSTYAVVLQVISDVLKW